MSFRTHLFFIAVIILTVSIFWRFTLEPNGQGLSFGPASPYKISIARASWKANCPEQSAPEIDNVKDRVATLCEGKPACRVKIDTATLGRDPAPECPDKQLEIEYRCFSYDKLRRARAGFGDIIIECEGTLPSPSP